MVKRLGFALMLALVALCTSVVTPALQAEELKLADGKISLKVSDTWKKKKPRSNILEAEYEVPGKDDKAVAGRLTFSAAGGGVEANIGRWYGQFEQPGGGDSSEKAKVDKLEVGGLKVTVVDLTGTFKEQLGGPLGPTEKRADYRLMGAVVELKGGGIYFVKLTGPNATLSANEEAFKELISSIKAGE